MRMGGRLVIAGLVSSNTAVVSACVSPAALRNTHLKDGGVVEANDQCDVGHRTLFADTRALHTYPTNAGTRMSVAVAHK